MISKESLSIIIGIASIAIAILIYFLQKKIKYPGRLNIALMEMFKVMNSSPDGYRGLSLKYNDYEIEEELSYIKFIVYNDRSFDYSSGGNDNPVRVTLPEDCKWVDAKVVGHSEEVQGEIIDKKEKELDLKFELLRKNEYIEIDGLIESKSKYIMQDFADKIMLHHRIANVSSSKSINHLNEQGYKMTRERMIFLSVLLFAMLGVLLYALVIHPTNPLRFKDLNNGEVYLFYVDKKGDIIFRDGLFIWSYSESISKEEFADQFEPYCEPASFKETDYYYCFMFLIPIFVLTMLLFRSIGVFYRSKKINKIIKLRNT